MLQSQKESVISMQLVGENTLLEELKYFCISNKSLLKSYFQLRHKIDIPVPGDKGLMEYMSWWESILGSAEEPEAPMIPADEKNCPACG